MQSKALLRTAGAIALLTAAPAALAHTGVGSSFSFASGASHPISGLDHLLAMVAVGLFAAQRGGRALWLAPATFVGTMALAALLAVSGVALPAVELGIAGSVLAFGLLVAVGQRLPLPAGVAIIALFALFHGHAHGSEMPLAASGLAYGLGFVLSTAALHATGLLGGLALRRTLSDLWLRACGLLCAGSGALLLLQV